MPFQDVVSDSKERHFDEGILIECHDKVTRSIDEGDTNKVRNYSYEEVEVLTKEIEEESQVHIEVCRIKEILANPGESTSLLYESLRRLELMQLSVEILKAIEVDSIKKNSSSSKLKSPNDASIKVKLEVAKRGFKKDINEQKMPSRNVKFK
eukprot:Gb_30814 [translate_table: standard]